MEEAWFREACENVGIPLSFCMFLIIENEFVCSV